LEKKAKWMEQEAVWLEKEKTKTDAMCERWDVASATCTAVFQTGEHVHFMHSCFPNRRA
jgi:hypothetical protein